MREAAGIRGLAQFWMPIRHTGGKAPNKDAGKGHRKSDPVAPETVKVHQRRKSCHFLGVPVTLPWPVYERGFSRKAVTGTEGFRIER